jgi:hypothetical protein
METAKASIAKPRAMKIIEIISIKSGQTILSALIYIHIYKN